MVFAVSIPLAVRLPVRIGRKLGLDSGLEVEVEGCMIGEDDDIDIIARLVSR